MDTITSIVNGAGELVEGLLAHAHLMSIVLGLALSFGLTQWSKGFIRLAYYRRARNPHDAMTEAESLARYRLAVRSIAILTGVIATLLTWPGGPWTHRIVWSLAVGAASPTAYWILTRVAARYWPEVAEYVSADSKLPGARRPADPPDDVA